MSEGPYTPLPGHAAMPMWKELVVETSSDFTRRVKALGSDETGYVVSVTEQQNNYCQPHYTYAAVGVCTPPRTFEVFMPLTAEQIVSIFSTLLAIVGLCVSIGAAVLYAGGAT